MKAYDFEFDGKSLSFFGMILCKFNSGGLETIDGVKINFNTVSTLNGKKHELISSQYEDCLEATFQICKHSCSGGGVQEITTTELRELTKWLGRKKFLKFKLLDGNSIDLYYEGAFTNISRIELEGKVIGLELTLLTNAPFARKEPSMFIIKNKTENGKHSINDTSYEEGYIYPHTEITISQNGDLTIHNAIEDRTTTIKNCTAGEVITLDYPIIQSSISSHNITNDFNYNFFRIANTYDMSRNDLTISLPCTIKLKYSPIVKIGL